MLFASFNYSGPDWGIIGTALGIGAALAFAAHTIKSMWFGVVAGVLYGGVGSWVVFSLGTGDMTELFQMIFSPVLAILGGIIGAIAAWAGKRAQPTSDAVEGRGGIES